MISTNCLSVYNSSVRWLMWKRRELWYRIMWRENWVLDIIHPISDLWHHLQHHGIRMLAPPAASNKQLLWTLSITSFYCISRILTMKLPSVLLLLPTLLLPLRAFQPTVGTPIRTQAAKLVSMNFFPDNFARAEYCATHSGACSLEELEVLADGRLRRYVALSQTSCSLYRYVPHCWYDLILCAFPRAPHRTKQIPAQWWWWVAGKRRLRRYEEGV